MRIMLRTAKIEAVTSSVQTAVWIASKKSRSVKRRTRVPATGPLFIACNGLLCHTCRAAIIPKSKPLTSVSISAAR